MSAWLLYDMFGSVSAVCSVVCGCGIWMIAEHNVKVSCGRKMIRDARRQTTLCTFEHHPSSISSPRSHPSSSVLEDRLSPRGRLHFFVRMGGILPVVGNDPSWWHKSRRSNPLGYVCRLPDLCVGHLRSDHWGTRKKHLARPRHLLAAMESLLDLVMGVGWGPY